MARSAKTVANEDTALRDALAAAITGEVDDSVRARAEYSTDASNYRVVPTLVVFPRNAQDVENIIDVCRARGVSITARGGGTSVAGNAIGTGVVVDFSRHMNRILEIDPEARTARVEPGVIMSDLQKAAAKYGLRFGPDPSTQNRACFGGMIGNNACGPRAVAYGRTSDNVLELTGIDGQGRHIHARNAADATDEKPIADIPGLSALVEQNLATIRQGFGTFIRQVSGYAFEHLLPENGGDLAKFLVGSEGTLVVLTEATLRLVPIADAPTLVILGYPDMPTAARDVPAILRHRPLAVEGLDAELIDVVRRAKGSVPELPEGGGWLFIEVGALEGEDLSIIDQRVAGILGDANTEHSMVRPAGPEASELWRIRADGAGLGGRTPDGNAAWPGWEDSAVPPENLGDYLTGLQALMDEMNLAGLMYGHFGDGCVHVRIDFPIDEKPGVAVFREFMERATDLAVAHGGSISGEHGDGRARSELLPRMYSPEALTMFRQVKHMFDPDNILNPGVLVAPDPIDHDLRRPDASPTPYADGFHFTEDEGDFTKAVHRCTGVGNCRADRSATGHFMCPSYLASRNEKDVTRGRARVLQEVTQGKLVEGFADKATLEVLDLCLSCKACSSDCPTGIDMARYKSETLFRAYKGKKRPNNHYILGNLPLLARLVTTIPGLAKVANFAMGIPLIRKIAFAVSRIDGRRKMVTFTEQRFSSWVDSAGTTRVASVRELPGLRPGKRGVDADSQAPKYVMLWSDSFSDTLDTSGAQAMVAVLQDAGYTVLIPPKTACCGLTYISTGQLNLAKKELRNLLSILAPFAASGIPIVGVEPSCTAVLRDDIRDLLPEDARTNVLSEMTYTLAELLTAPAPLGPDNFEMPDLSGVEIVAQPHCHHYSVMGWDADAQLLAQSGATVKQVSGCCGLAGNFGMEKGHYDMSVAVANNALLPALEGAAEDAVYLADGFSCRTQAAQLAGDQGIHLAELIRDGRNARRKNHG
ncbi:MAG: FAD-binding oxidoreductase [Actinomycetaceae bacterium]|nr:FAD-binding oxidoreductase [Actinomycetaceae bacterium]